MSVPLFDRATILHHLEELNAELARHSDRRLQLLVVGGSYLALHGLRSGTRDIDTALRLEEAAARAVAVIAERGQLPAYWLNDSAAPFLPADFDATRSIVVAEYSHLVVRVPHADDVFVMKLSASRGEGDLADMVRLWPTCSFRSARAVVSRYVTAYPHEADDPFLEAFVAEHVIARATPTGIDGGIQT